MILLFGDALRARRRSSDQPRREDEMLRALTPAGPARTGAGQLIRHREIGRQKKSASSPEGPGFNLLRLFELVVTRGQIKPIQGPVTRQSAAFAVAIRPYSIAVAGTRAPVAA